MDNTHDFSKIIENKELMHSIHSFIEKYGEKELQYILQKYVHAPDTYLCKTSESATKIPIKDIYFVEIWRREIYIYTETRFYTKSGSLNKELEFLKPYGFIRCHKSIIVAVDKIAFIEQNYIILKNGKRVFLGRNYANAVLNEYANHICL